MVSLDDGKGLRQLYYKITCRSLRGANLFVVIPFIEKASFFWQRTLSAAKNGVRVHLVTRTPTEPQVVEDIHELQSFGARTLFVKNLHAKAVLWLSGRREERSAYVGSLNFTWSSEQNVIELGLLVTGNGPVEDLIYRDFTWFICGLENIHCPAVASRCLKRHHNYPTSAFSKRVSIRS